MHSQRRSALQYPIHTELPYFRFISETNFVSMVSLSHVIAFADILGLGTTLGEAYNCSFVHLGMLLGS